MSRRMNELEKEFGFVEFEGKHYVFLDQPDVDTCIDREGYSVSAVCSSDAADDGWLPSYRIFWKLKEGVDLNNLAPEFEDDASTHCDWDMPTDVVMSGSCRLD